MCMVNFQTIVVNVFCPCRGSLSDAIAKGAFNKAGADNGSSPLARGAARGSNPQPGRPAGSPAAPLLSMLGTARDIALGMHHLHLDGIVHGGELHRHCFSVKQSSRAWIRSVKIAF
jgi:hypothetical protein